MKNYLTMLSKIALNQYKAHEVRREWRVFILFVFLAKTLTWVVSVYAGQNYFSNLTYAIIEDKTATLIAAIVALIILEVLTTIALSKFFKFLFRGVKRLKTIITMACVVAFLFSISFISSTNGLAMRQSKKVDKSEVIYNRSGIQKESIKEEFESRKQDIELQITMIKSNPEGWTGGRRNVLLPHQNKKVDSLYRCKALLLDEQKAALVSINDQVKSELEINKQETTAEANKYYNVITWVMIIQFLSSGILMFFWKKIVLEENPDALITEEVHDHIELGKEIVNNAIKQGAESTSLTYATVLNNARLLPSKLVDQGIHTEPATEPIKEPERRKVIGFINHIQKQSEISRKSLEQPKRPDNTKDINQELKNVNYLKKHKEIVIVMKENGLPKDDKIHNSDAFLIGKEAKQRGAKYSGRTLVREVFQIYNTIGADRIRITNNDIEII